ncbi:MAG TPA: hypothetical protein V6C81_18890 [Planktothrix sp.]|jgi:hypothetical protein
MAKNESVFQAATTSVSQDDAVACHGEVVESSGIEPIPAGTTNGDTNSVQVNLQTSGLAFQVHTQMPVSSQIIDLAARVELLTAQLEQAQSQLQKSMHRIGYLEAQLEQQKQLVDHLCKQQEA